MESSNNLQSSHRFNEERFKNNLKTFDAKFWESAGIITKTKSDEESLVDPDLEDSPMAGRSRKKTVTEVIHQKDGDLEQMMREISTPLRKDKLVDLSKYKVDKVASDLLDETSERDAKESKGSWEAKFDDIAVSFRSTTSRKSDDLSSRSEHFPSPGHLVPNRSRGAIPRSKTLSSSSDHTSRKSRIEMVVKTDHHHHHARPLSERLQSSTSDSDNSRRNKERRKSLSHSPTPPHHSPTTPHRRSRSVARSEEPRISHGHHRSRRASLYGNSRRRSVERRGSSIEPRGRRRSSSLMANRVTVKEHAGRDTNRGRSPLGGSTTPRSSRRSRRYSMGQTSSHSPVPFDDLPMSPSRSRRPVSQTNLSTSAAAAAATRAESSPKSPVRKSSEKAKGRSRSPRQRPANLRNASRDKAPPPPPPVDLDDDEEFEEALKKSSHRSPTNSASRKSRERPISMRNRGTSIGSSDSDSGEFEEYEEPLVGSRNSPPRPKGKSRSPRARPSSRKRL